MQVGLGEKGAEACEDKTGKGKAKGVRNGACSSKEVTAGGCADKRETPLGKGKEWHPHHSVCIPAYDNHTWEARRKRDQSAQLQL